MNENEYSERRVFFIETIEAKISFSEFSEYLKFLKIWLAEGEKTLVAKKDYGMFTDFVFRCPDRVFVLKTEKKKRWRKL